MNHVFSCIRSSILRNIVAEGERQYEQLMADGDEQRARIVQLGTRTVRAELTRRHNEGDDNGTLEKHDGSEIHRRMGR